MYRRTGQWVLSIVVGSIAAMVLHLFYFSNGMEFRSLSMVIITIVFGIGIKFMIGKYDERLTKRIENETPIHWSIWMNDVRIGAVTDAQYAAMQRQVLGDSRTAGAQIINLGQVTLAVFNKLLITMPLLFFWGIIFLAGFDPDSYTEMVHWFQKADSAALKSAIESFLHMGASIALLCIGLLPCFGFRFGYMNHYSAAAAKLLRLHCNIVADGDITLERSTDHSTVALT